METEQKSHPICKSDSFEDLFKRSIGCLDTTIEENQVDDDEKQASEQEHDSNISIEVAFNPQDLEDSTEEEIESNFTSYRPYIESCIKLLDLIVFFNMFTSGQVKMFYKLSKSNPVNALRRAFDAIVAMDNVPGKFHILLQALEEAEYPKIVNLLRGLLIKVHGKHRQKLKMYAKDIYQRLSVCDILPYLLTKRVINNHDIEEIKSVEKNESRGSAVMQLLSILPNRSRDWYEHFLWALVESKQKALAMIIDKEFTERPRRSSSLANNEFKLLYSEIAANNEFKEIAMPLLTSQTTQQFPLRSSLFQLFSVHMLSKYLRNLCQTSLSWPLNDDKEYHVCWDLQHLYK